MKKSLLFILLLCMQFAVKLHAQLLPPLQPEQDACNALLLCGNSFTTPYSYVGEGNIPDLTNTPCSGGEGNVMWIRLNINTSGTIVFTISPLNLTDDYDFAVLDITNTTCNNLSVANVIRCNFNNNWPGSNVNGVIGLNTTSTALYTTAGATGGSFLQQINANAGDVYLVMVNNFGDPFVGGPSSGFTIDFTGSTATFYDNGNPTLGAVIPSCNNSQQITVQMSENIKCNSIALDGTDFSLSSGSIASASGINCSSLGGYTDKIVLNFASPLAPGTYTLNAQTGTDGNTLLDLCDNPVLLPNAIQFTIPPYVQPAYLAIDTPACSEIKITLAGKVNCDSIAANGSDFSISGPQTTSIVAAYGIGCDTANFTDTVVLFLQAPLQTDGTYTITAQNGTDGNTLIDSCGLLQSVGDAISYTINTFDGRIVSVNDTVLCKAGYIVLNADNYSDAPYAPVNCDVTTSSCTGNTHAAFVGGADVSTDVNTPFFGQWEDSKTQYLFLASELRNMGLKAGSIRKLEWKVTQKNSTLPYNGFSIKIGCTPMSDLSGGYASVANYVYSASSYTSTLGWNTFELSTPYNWDGTSNLIVEVCYDNSSSSSNDRVMHSTTPFNSVIHRYGNGLSGCSITTGGSASPFTTQRPKIRFSICEPPVGPANYTWSPGTFVDDSTLQQTLTYINSSITYQIKTIDRYGCMHRDTTSIIRSNRDVSLFPAPDTTICVGEKVLLQAAGGQDYAWESSDISSLNCTDCATPVAAPLQTSNYTVVINDQYNCFDTLHTIIYVNPLPVLTTFPGDTTVKYGTELQLGVAGAYLYQWTPAGHVSDPNINIPVATITEPTIFTVTGIDSNGCRQTDTIHVNVDYTDVVFIPSAFTPNGDGRNDVFRIGSISFQKLQEFRIFNRWGEQVFSTTNPLNGWDGRYNGADQEAGVYQYLIKISYPNGVVRVYKGDVTLVR